LVAATAAAMVESSHEENVYMVSVFYYELAISGGNTPRLGRVVRSILGIMAITMEGAPAATEEEVVTVVTLMVEEALLKCCGATARSFSPWISVFSQR
jgi:hypothetical protein